MSQDAERLAALLDAWLAGEPAAASEPELADLLAMAARVRDLTVTPPPPAGLRRGRAAFIAAGVAQAEARAQAGGWPRWLAVGSGLRGRLVPVALALALVFLGTVATTTQAQVSLPGDVLYPVKRLGESVQVALARTDDRAAIEADLQRRRRDEAQALLAQKRAETVAFQGLVTAVNGSRLTIDGLTVTAGAVWPDGAGVVGALVRIEGTTGADGVVRAQRVVVLRPPAAETEAVLAVATPVERLMTPVAPERTPTERRRTATSAPGLATRAPSPTARPTTAPTAVPATPEPSPVVGGPKLRERQPPVELWGQLERMDSEWWVVAGQEFYQPSGRVVGNARLGAQVHVRAERRQGKLYLIELVVINAAPQPEVIEWRGAIEAMAADRWTIGGQEVLVTADTQVTGEPAIGRMANVRAELYPDDRRVALLIEVDAAVADVEFTGLLESFGPTEWVVNGRRLSIVPGTTEIRGTAWVGAVVDVRARPGGEGQLVALLLNVRGTPPLPTMTPGTGGLGPTASPSPEATAIGPVHP